MQRKIELKRCVDNTSVEAYLVDLVQRHIDDYVNYWVESLRLFSQEDKYWETNISPRQGTSLITQKFSLLLQRQFYKLPNLYDL